MNVENVLTRLGSRWALRGDAQARVVFPVREVVRKIYSGASVRQEPERIHGLLEMRLLKMRGSLCVFFRPRTRSSHRCQAWLKHDDEGALER